MYIERVTRTFRAFEGMRRNIIRLASGTLLSQALLLSSTPFLTRIFSPDAFGVLAVFSATYAIIIPIMTLKYDAALILPKSNQSAISITALVLIISSSLALISGFLLWLAHKLSWPHAIELSLWLPIALWLGAMYTLMQQWSARRNNYQHFARSQVIGAFLNIIISLSLGLLLGGESSYLVMGLVFGMAGSFIYMYWKYPPHLVKIHSFQLKRIYRRARAYIQFPSLVLPATLLNIVGQSSIPLILAANYSMTEIGQFSLANRLLLMPTALIGGALSEAFRAELVKRVRQRTELAQLMNTTLMTLLFLAIPLFGILLANAPMLFSLVFGTGYEISGYVARAIGLALVAQFIGNPFFSVFLALRRSDVGLVIQFATTVAPLLLLILVAANDMPLMTALHVYSATTALSIAIVICLAFKLCKSVDGVSTTKSLKC